jgi:hypothetical protein
MQLLECTPALERIGALMEEIGPTEDGEVVYVHPVIGAEIAALIHLGECGILAEATDSGEPFGTSMVLVDRERTDTEEAKKAPDGPYTYYKRWPHDLINTRDLCVKVDLT